LGYLLDEVRRAEVIGTDKARCGCVLRSTIWRHTFWGRQRCGFIIRARLGCFIGIITLLLY
jgi:hypothetical protein